MSRKQEFQGNKKLNFHFCTLYMYIRNIIIYIYNYYNKEYKNKFMTCARSRSKEQQILGAEFYELEHSKKLFNENNMLTVYS